MKLPSGQSLFLNHSEGSAFGSSLPVEIANGAEKRKRDWLTSRVALQRLLEFEGEKPTAFQVALAHRQSLPAFPQFKFSISHSSSGALVWLVPTSAQFFIGVDAEDERREFDPKLAQRIRNEQDLKSLSTLELWSLKEAIYKSLPQLQQKGLAFSKIYIQQNEFFIPELSVKGQWLQKKEQGNICSFAWFT